MKMANFLLQIGTPKQQKKEKLTAVDLVKESSPYKTDNMMSKKERNNNEKMNLKRIKISFLIVGLSSAEKYLKSLMELLK